MSCEETQRHAGANGRYARKRGCCWGPCPSTKFVQSLTPASSFLFRRCCHARQVLENRGCSCYCHYRQGDLGGLVVDRLTPGPLNGIGRIDEARNSWSFRRRQLFAKGADCESFTVTRASRRSISKTCSVFVADASLLICPMSQRWRRWSLPETACGGRWDPRLTIGHTDCAAIIRLKMFAIGRFPWKTALSCAVRAG